MVKRMKKAIILLAVFSMLLGTCGSAFAQEPSEDGLRMILDLMDEADMIEDGILMITLSAMSGDEELASGATISYSGGDGCIEDIFLSIPQADSTTLDLEEEDVLRYVKGTLYLNTEVLQERKQELIADSTNESLARWISELPDLPSEGWIGIPDIDMKAWKSSERGRWQELFARLEVTEEAGAYTVVFGNKEIEMILTELEEQEPEYAVDQGGDSLLQAFQEAVKQGLEVSGSVCIGKDTEAETYAFWMEVQLDIPRELEEQFDILQILGENSEADKEDMRSVIFSCLLSIEPAEEPAEIRIPEEVIFPEKEESAADLSSEEAQ